MTDQKIRQFDIVFEGKARSSGRMRCDVDVEFVTTGEKFVMATDEGSIHGGENSAPPPLAYFTSALAGCLMTQFRAFAKRLRVPVNSIDIKARLHWKAEQTGREPYVGWPVAFELDIDVDSEAGPEDIKRVLNAARKGCFVEASLAPSIEVRHRLKVGDSWIAV